MRRPAPVALGAGFAAAAAVSLLRTGGALASPAPGDDRLAQAFLRARASDGARAFRVLHLGDSHVAGGTFSASVGGLLGGVLRAPVEVRRQGTVGARADRLLLGDSDGFARLVRLSRPDLVILTYGTNEARERDLDLAAYRRALELLLGQIREAAPGAAVVVSGPPEQERRSREGGFAPVRQLAQVSSAQEGAARDAGAVFVDLSREMGGPWTLGRWALERPPLVGPDRVHFTSEGYERLARLLVGRLVDVVNQRLAAGAEGPAREPFRAPPERVATGRRLRDGAGFVPGEPASDVRAFRGSNGRLVLTNLPPPPGPPVLSRRGP